LAEANDAVVRQVRNEPDPPRRVDVQVAAEAAREIEDVDVVEREAVFVEHHLQSRDVRALGLRQLVDVALREEDAVFGVEGESLESILEAAHLVHAVSAQQLAEQVHQAGATNTFGLDVADDAELEAAVVVDGDGFYGALETRHAARDGAAFEGGTRRTRCSHDAAAVPDDELRVRADVHQRDQAIFVGEVDREHARRGVCANVSADHRRAVHARLRMNRQQ